MLQNLLQSLLPVLQNAAALMVPVALLLAFAGRRPEKLSRWLWEGVCAGLGASFIIAVLRITASLRSREVIEGWMLLLSLVAGVSVIFFYWRAYRGNYPQKESRVPFWTAFLFPFALMLYQGFETFLLFHQMLLPPATLAWAELLLRLCAILLGLGLALLAGWAVYRVALALPVGRLLAGWAACIAIIMLQQMVGLIQILLARGLLPMKKWLLALMIPLINHMDRFFLALVIAALSFPLLLLWQRRPAQPAGLNPAQYRKLLAAVRRQMRWGVVSLASLALIFALATAGRAYADQKAELTPAVPIAAQKGEVSIPLNTVDDGRLYRYSYTASNGTVMRFIIIKKSGSAYGVGLDACDICGPTGYYERDGNVVCKLCDVIMNKATIGFKGGCNPVPIAYKVAGGKIVITADALEQEKKRFR